MFRMSNVELALSPVMIDHPNLESIGEENRLHIYRVRSHMGCCRQVASPLRPAQDGVVSDARAARGADAPVKWRDEGDLLEFDLRSTAASLLVVSNKFHPYRHADVRTATGWTRAQTPPVNGVFRGVILPPASEKAILRFLPAVRFAWIAHVLWLIVLAWGMAETLRAKAAARRDMRGLRR